MLNIQALNENEEIVIGDVAEYARYSMEIERTFAELQKGLALCYDPKEVALNAMRVATEFYDADWCGIFEVDLELGLFTPFWWYNRQLGAMSRTLVSEFEVMNYQRWKDSLVNHTAMVITDIEEVRDTYPEEYELYSRVQAKSDVV